MTRIPEILPPAKKVVMSKRTSSRLQRLPAESAARSPMISGPIARVIGGSMMCAVAAGLAIGWYQLFPPAPERTIDVYQRPRCPCTRGWVRSLKDDGFIVRVTMTEALRATRRAFNMPPILHGCHVGVYLNYFLEGRVAAAVRDLAIHRPSGRGLVTQAAFEAAESQSGATVDENSPVLLLGPDGRSSSPWYRPGS
jgi:hypothetical protein